MDPHVQDIVLDVKMIAKMIMNGVMSEITILLCDAPSEGKFSAAGNGSEVHESNFHFR